MGISDLDFDQVVKDLAALRKDVASLLGSARTVAVDGADSMYGQLKRRANEPVHVVSDYVKEQPITGVLIAFGVGYLLAQLTRHNHR